MFDRAEGCRRRGACAKCAFRALYLRMVVVPLFLYFLFLVHEGRSSVSIVWEELADAWRSERGRIDARVILAAELGRATCAPSDAFLNI